MKRVLPILLVIVLLLCGCGTEGEKIDKIEQPENVPTAVKTDFSGGMWLSYSDMDSLLADKDQFKTNFNLIISNLKTFKTDTLYLHVRSHCDSIFKSQFYPLRDSVKEYDYDVLSYIIEKCHKENIKVFAWLNPYRVSTATENITELPQDSPAYKWCNDTDKANDDNVVYFNGIYLNPAKQQVRQLVIDGIKEIIDNYDVDGIHFDDYFYPTDEKDFDKVTYENYCKETKNPLSLADWRRAGVDSLISDCKTAIEIKKKKIIFSISPAADINKNYSEFFADVEGWIEKGYVDEIIPQIYFGYEHTMPEFKFETLLSKWQKLGDKNPDVKLLIGLAAYKIGSESETDGTEWKDNEDMIARQVKSCYDAVGVDGVVYFSYSSLFATNVKALKEVENLCEVLNNIGK